MRWAVCAIAMLGAGYLFVSIDAGAEFESAADASTSQRSVDLLEGGPELRGRAATPPRPTAPATEAEPAPDPRIKEVRGRVVDDAEQGMANIPVEITGYYLGHRMGYRSIVRGGSATGTTAQDGSFRIQVKCHTVRIREFWVRAAAPEGHAPHPPTKVENARWIQQRIGRSERGPAWIRVPDARWREGGAGDWAPVLLRLPRARTLQVQIRHASGAPCTTQPSVAARWAHADLGHHTLQKKADAQGRVTFAVPLATAATLRADIKPKCLDRLTAGERAWAQWSVAETQDVSAFQEYATITLADRQGPLGVGRVTRPADRAFRTDCVIWQEDVHGSRLSLLRRDGSFRFLAHPGKPLRVSWHAETTGAREQWFAAVRTNAFDKPVVLHARRGVRVSFTDASGTSWAQTGTSAIWLPDDRTLYEPRSVFRAWFRPKEVGAFPWGEPPPPARPPTDVWLPPVPGKLLVHDTVRRRFSVHELSGEEDIVVPPPHEPGATITGWVADRASVVGDEQVGPAVAVTVGDWEVEAATDAQGAFVVHGVPEGEVEVRLVGRGASALNPRTRWRGHAASARDIVLHLR